MQDPAVEIVSKLRLELEQLKALNEGLQAELDLIKASQTAEIRARSENLLEFAPDAFFQGDPQGNFILVNRNAMELTGFSRSELLRMNLQDLFSEHEVNRKPLRYDLLLEGHNIITERVIQRQDGTEVAVEMSSTKNSDGTYQSFMRDISQRIEQREALRESEERYAKALMLSPDSVCISKADGTYVDVNRGFTELSGFTAEEVIGKTSLQVHTWAHVEDRNKLIEGLQKSDRVLNMEAEFRLKDGSIKTGLMSAVRMMLKGEPHFLTIVRDISERKRMEEDLKRAKNKAEESDRLKSAFLANLSHEIRTPLNGILGFADLLKDGDLDEANRLSYCDTILRSGNNLLSIINDIIEISKIETRQLKPTLDDVEIDLMLESLITQFNYKLSSNQQLSLVLQTEPEETLPNLKTDGTKLNQILTNLLGNAIKFTPRGEVRLRRRYNEEAGILEIDVVDTGVGIVASDQELIFERFRQAEHPQMEVPGGSGLGLSISKAYAEMLGGKLTMTSEVGKGSCFTVSIPCEPVEEIAKPPRFVGRDTDSLEDGSDGKQGVVLVAEDDPVNFEYMSAILNREGIAFVHAQDGVEALELFRCREDVCLILMDIKMPRMNGFEALEALRSEGCQVPVIAQTAYALPEDQKRIEAAGFNGYLTKPINSTRLLECIRGHHCRHSSRTK